jgi:hypothetical protein
VAAVAAQQSTLEFTDGTGSCSITKTGTKLALSSGCCADDECRIATDGQVAANTASIAAANTAIAAANTNFAAVLAAQTAVNTVQQAENTALRALVTGLQTNLAQLAETHGDDIADSDAADAAFTQTAADLATAIDAVSKLEGPQVHSALNRHFALANAPHNRLSTPEQGAKGDKGDKGNNGNTGGKGDKGDKGDDGSTPTIADVYAAGYSVPSYANLGQDAVCLQDSYGQNTVPGIAYGNAADPTFNSGTDRKFVWPVDIDTRTEPYTTAECQNRCDTHNGCKCFSQWQRVQPLTADHAMLYSGCFADDVTCVRASCALYIGGNVHVSDSDAIKNWLQTFSRLDTKSITYHIKGSATIKVGNTLYN